MKRKTTKKRVKSGSDRTVRVYARPGGFTERLIAEGAFGPPEKVVRLSEKEMMERAQAVRRPFRTVPVNALLNLDPESFGIWQFVVENEGLEEHPLGGRLVPEEIREGRGKAKAERDEARARQMGDLVKAGLAKKVPGGWRVLPLRKPAGK